MIVIGRGLGLAIAQEAALKLKETSGIQAEAFSSAEVRHGPMELIGEDYPLLVFAPRGPEQAGLIQLARDMRARGARVLLAAPADVPEATLPLVETAHFGARSDRRNPVLLCDGRRPGCRARAQSRRAAPSGQSHRNPLIESHPMRRAEESLLNHSPENPNDFVLLAPFTGPMVPLADVPDPVFADGMFGDGIGIDPLAGALVAPCDGVITHLARTRHAVTLRTSQGAEILLHIGIDTVELARQGFYAEGRAGRSVRTGQVLIEFDADYVAQNAPSLVSVIAIANSDAFEVVDVLAAAC